VAVVRELNQKRRREVSSSVLGQGAGAVGIERSVKDQGRDIRRRSSGMKKASTRRASVGERG